MAKTYEMDQKRVVGFLGHAGSGKTSICEAILFNTKATERLGAVDAHTAVMDFEPEEHKRGYSVNSSFYDCDYKGHHLFLIDTPGNSNFIPDAFTLMPALGAAVVPVDAVEGVKFQTELVSIKAKEMGLPVLAFISKLDKEHANFDKAFESMKAAFAVEPVLIQIPIGLEDGHKGVVDLLTNKAYTYANGKATAGEIPADMADTVEELRAEMIERLVEGDDEIMEKYLETEEVSDEELFSCLKSGTLGGQFCPVLCGSPTQNTGIDRLLETIVAALPNPTEERPRTLIDPKTAEESELIISAEGNLVAQVIKTLSDPFAGKVSIMRIFRGHIDPDDNFFNVEKRSKEKPGKFHYQHGKSQTQVDAAEAGDIIALIKLKDVATGDTLVQNENQSVKMPDLPRVSPMVHMAVTAKVKGEEEKMGAAIYRILDEDANLSFWREEQTKDFILSGVGAAQFDVARERMARKFSVEVEFAAPKVPYRETIKGKAEVQGRYKKQTGGRGQFGDCHIRVSAQPRGAGFEFVDAIVGGVIPRQFIPAVEKGIVEAMVRGEMTGNPVQDVKVELFFGSYHSVDSSEMAFKVAGSMAWKKAMMEATPCLLEPVNKVDITVPSEYMGDVYGNLSSRRGRVLGSDEEGRMTVIHAEIPVVEMHTLATDLRAMTGDRAAFISHFDHYEEVPSAIADKLVAEFQAEKEEG